MFSEQIDVPFGRQEVSILLSQKRLGTSAIYAKQNHDLLSGFRRSVAINWLAPSILWSTHAENS
jgi:hypothetical protein